MMKMNLKNELYSWGKSLLLAIIVVVACRYFIFTPIAVDGESMLPTFEDNDRVIVSKIGSIDRFDIVIFEDQDSDEQYIKRVIGVQGDSIQVKDDVLYINGKAYEEFYVNKDINDVLYNNITGDFTLEELTGEETVPEGYYFVLGDNRWKSRDSRSQDFGFISADAIIGEAKFRYYPFQKIGMPE